MSVATQEAPQTTTVPPTEELTKLNLKNGSAPQMCVTSSENNVQSAPKEECPSSTTPSQSATKDERPTSTTPGPGSAPKSTFKEQFKAFSKFGDPKSDGKLITLSQSDKWMKQAKVIDGKKITTTDTGIYFKKLKSLKVGFEDYKRFLEDLAKNKKVNLEQIQEKMANCGPPGFHGVGPTKTPSAVERLTDVSKYTGSHKQRFDETGKGKGIAGRKDLHDNSGYVTGYQNKDSYQKGH